MKIKLLIVFVLLIYSCKSVVSNAVYVGEYSKRIKDYECNLTLKENQKFSLKINSIGGSSGCNGLWEKVNDSLVVLNCDKPANIEETLQGGYMTQRQINIKIKNPKELLYKEITLQRS